MKRDRYPPPADRPLRLVDRKKIISRFERSLALRDGLSAAHCVHELWMRNEFPVRIEAMLAQLWRQCSDSVPEWVPMRYVDWLSVVYEIAARFSSSSRGRANIYLILLDYSDRNDGPFGVYVGMTDYPPAQRFDQHKAGIRAAGSVLKRGIEVLAGPTLHLQKIKRSDAARIEIDLAEALAETRLIVQGGH